MRLMVVVVVADRPPCVLETSQAQSTSPEVVEPSSEPQPFHGTPELQI